MAGAKADRGTPRYPSASHLKPGPEGDLRFARVEARCLWKRLPSPEIIAHPMAEGSEPQPRERVVAGQLHRCLEADERLTEVALDLGLPAARDQPLDFGGHGDKTTSSAERSYARLIG